MQKLDMCHINYPGEEGGRECQPPRNFFLPMHLVRIQFMGQYGWPPQQQLGFLFQ